MGWLRRRFIRRLYFPESSDKSEIRDVAVAIADLDRTHCGIFYRTAAGDLFLLHLCWHTILRKHSADEIGDRGFVWVVPRFLPEQAVQIAELCELIWRCRPDIPYALRHSELSMFSLLDGNFNLGSGSHGLTCATFVLAVCRSVGVSLLDLADWRERGTDVPFQEYVVSELAKSPGHREHAAVVASEIGCLRYRPEEVAGACMFDFYPIGFRAAERSGIALLAEIDEYYSCTGRRKS